MNVTTLAKEMAVARGCSHYNNQLDGDAPGGIQDQHTLKRLYSSEW